MALVGLPAEEGPVNRKWPEHRLSALLRSMWEQLTALSFSETGTGMQTLLG